MENLKTYVTMIINSFIRTIIKNVIFIYKRCLDKFVEMTQRILI